MNDTAAFLAALPADGSSVGNLKLRDALAWDQVRYEAIRDQL
ncbi:MAG: hypothetical protein ACOCXA_00455 [Planctomycetota bacterium]